MLKSIAARIHCISCTILQIELNSYKFNNRIKVTFIIDISDIIGIKNIVLVSLFFYNIFIVLIYFSVKKIEYPYQ